MNKSLVILIIGLCNGLFACNSNPTKNKEEMETFDIQTVNGIFPLGQLMPENFTGTVHYQGLVNAEDMEGLYTVGQVTFSPGARTHWHTHPAGQVLLVTSGRGWYQIRGEEPIELVKGSVIAIPKDVEHWHGASATEGMVHIAISNFHEGSNVTWMTPVTEEEYIKD